MNGSGTAVGLLRHELRLTWRGWFSRGADGKPRGRAQKVITLVALGAIFLLAGIPAAMLLRHVQVRATPLLEVIGAGTACALYTLMLSQTLGASVGLLYDRGDLDLLLSSPVHPTRILATRAVSMTMSAVLIFAVVLSPMLAPIALLGHPAWLATYVVLGALGLAATGSGLLLAVAMMSTLGPRATKTVAQLLAALIGAAIFIISQLQNILGGHQVGNAFARLALSVRAGEVRLPAFAGWPTRAALGEPGPLGIVVLCGAAVFAASVLILGRRFADNAALAKGGDVASLGNPQARAGRFRRGAFVALLVKELRLLRRDPGLLSQVLLRVLYIIPLVLLVMRNASGAHHRELASAAAGMVFMAGQVTGSLSWITISAEEAPELLAMSPAATSGVWTAKLAACVIPIAVLLAGPLLALVYLAPAAGLIAILGCAGAAASSGLVNIWLQQPSKRRDFRGRRDASVAATLAELGLCALWASSVGLGVMGYLGLALAPLAGALVVLAVVHQPQERILRRLAEASA